MKMRTQRWQSMSAVHPSRTLARTGGGGGVTAAAADPRDESGLGWWLVTPPRANEVRLATPNEFGVLGTFRQFDCATAGLLHHLSFGAPLPEIGLPEWWFRTTGDGRVKLMWRG